MKNPYLLPTAVIATVMLVGSFMMYLAAGRFVTAKENLVVTGSARKAIKADLGILTMSLNPQAPTAAEAYKQLMEDQKQLTDYLKSKGVPAEAIEAQNIMVDPVFRIADNGMITSDIVGYRANQSVRVSLKDVEKIKELSQSVPSLIETGLNINTFPPEYLCTNIGSIKIEMQAAAAQDAQERARRIVEATGSNLGPLVQARMGVIQITPANSSMISDAGVNDMSAVDKEITAVVSATFMIR